MRENTDQKNTEYGHFLRSVTLYAEHDSNNATKVIEYIREQICKWI